MLTKFKPITQQELSVFSAIYQLEEQDPENVCHDEGQTDVEREPLGGPAALDGQVLGHVGHDSAEDHGELAAEGNLKLNKEE